MGFKNTAVFIAGMITLVYVSDFLSRTNLSSHTSFSFLMMKKTSPPPKKVNRLIGSMFLV